MNEAPAGLARPGAARLFALGGVALVLAALLLGEIYAVFVSHVANAAIREAWTGVVDGAITGDAALVRERFAVIDELADKRGRFMSTHSHLGAFGLLALALAVLQPALALPAARARALAVLYLTGATAHPAGLFTGHYTGTWALYLADAAGLLVIAAVAGTLAGLVRGTGAAVALAAALVAARDTGAGRLLLKAGLVLILAGMLFGLHHAWRLVAGEEASVYLALDAAVSATARGEREAAQKAIMDFKRQQSRNAITAAAHSHAIEFGFLMALLAFLQAQVLLSPAWRLRWARVMIAGAFLLPVCVFLATRYGLGAAAFADLGGALVTIALLAMGVGMLRYTGAADARAVGPA